MKSLGKLKRLAFQKNNGKDKRELHLPAKLDDLALASQEMEDMRNCYDSLLSAAAATTNSAFEFSLSLREMGDCFLEKSVLYNDKDSGKLFAILGKLQFELQKLVDHYRSHIVLTITNPSESLLKELRTVEEMKQQCDEKRGVYEYTMEQQREKARSKCGKGEGYNLEDIKAAYTQYEEEATLCSFRLKSLKEGQSRSLLTQAARHHTAQLNFFRKAFKSVEVVDPYVKQVTEKHHIDYQVSGLDDADDEGEESETTHDSQDHGELSFDQQHAGGEATSRNSMEVDQEDKTFSWASTLESTETSLGKVRSEYEMKNEQRISSHSAPILAEKKFDPADRIRQMRPPVQKFHAHVLPTPAADSSNSRISAVSMTRPTKINGQSSNVWFSSPLETKMNKRDPKNDLSVNISREKNSNETVSNLPPLSVGQTFSQSDGLGTSDYKKIKRYAFSGPLSSNSQSMRPSSAIGSLVPLELPRLASGSSQPSLPQPPPASKVSSSRSLSLSPPKVSELHELPRPPSLANISVMTSGSIGHSAPLVLRNMEASFTHKNVAVVPNMASPLPAPPCSLSVPSYSHTTESAEPDKLYDSSRPPEKDESAASMPLTPVSLAKP